MRFRQSELKSWLVDQRQWYLTYWLNPYPNGQTPVGDFPGASELGTLVHTAMAASNLGAVPDTAVRDWLFAEGKEQVPEYVTAAADALFYAKRYTTWNEVEGNDVGTTLLGVELQLEAELAGHTIYGSLDRLDTGPHGVGVLDYKTGKQFRQLMANDFQLLTYGWMARECGYGSPTRATYARIKTVKATKTEPQDHVHIPLSDDILDQHERHLTTSLREIEDMVTSLDQGMDPVDIRPVTSPDCFWRCDAMAACTVMSDGGYWEDVLPYPSGPSAGFNQRGSTSHEDTKG